MQYESTTRVLILTGQCYSRTTSYAITIEHNSTPFELELLCEEFVAGLCCFDHQPIARQCGLVFAIGFSTLPIPWVLVGKDIHAKVIGDIEE